MTTTWTPPVDQVTDKRIVGRHRIDVAPPPVIDLGIAMTPAACNVLDRQTGAEMFGTGLSSLPVLLDRAEAEFDGFSLAGFIATCHTKTVGDHVVWTSPDGRFVVRMKSPAARTKAPPPPGKDVLPTQCRPRHRCLVCNGTEKDFGSMGDPIRCAECRAKWRSRGYAWRASDLQVVERVLDACARDGLTDMVHIVEFEATIHTSRLIPLRDEIRQSVARKWLRQDHQFLNLPKAVLLPEEPAQPSGPACPRCKAIVLWPVGGLPPGHFVTCDSCGHYIPDRLFARYGVVLPTREELPNRRREYARVRRARQLRRRAWLRRNLWDAVVIPAAVVVVVVLPLVLAP